MSGVRQHAVHQQQQRTVCLLDDTPFSVLSGGKLTIKISLFIVGSMKSRGKVGFVQLGNLFFVFRQFHTELHTIHDIRVV